MVIGEFVSLKFAVGVTGLALIITTQKQFKEVEGN